VHTPVPTSKRALVFFDTWELETMVSSSSSRCQRTAVTVPSGVIRRLLFVIFFCLGGFLFYIPKWILMGTRGERQRKKILKQQGQILKSQRQ
jgi:hypothetical protein